MEENNNKKSRAIIITIIILILLLIFGYLLFKNRDVFGVKTSNGIAKIFSPLISSNKTKDLNTGNTSCTNNATNPPACTTVNGACINGNTNPPECNNSACANGTDNPPLCTTINGACLNGATNPPECTALAIRGPDLVMGIITPTSSTINTPTAISSTVTNRGGESTKSGFSAFFTITTTKNTNSQTSESDPKKIEMGVTIPTLEAGVGSAATITYNFKSIGIYYVRACADKKSLADIGVVAESNENNNCGPWTTVTVSNSLPVTGVSNYSISTNLDNTNTNPKTATQVQAPNVCQDIEKNPLTFTDAEQSKLNELLRKFYLIAPTLKTSDDISLTYSDLIQQQNFIDQLNTLTKECYIETSSPSYTGPKAQYGNPWYRYDMRGSYLDASYDKTNYCMRAPGDWPHKSFDCPSFKDKFSCEQYEFTPWLGTRQTLDTGCIWNDPLNLREYETILNVW